MTLPALDLSTSSPTPTPPSVDAHVTQPAAAPDALLGNYKRAPVRFVGGEGVYLEGADGRRYLDFVSGIAVNALVR